MTSTVPLQFFILQKNDSHFKTTFTLQRLFILQVKTIHLQQSLHNNFSYCKEKREKSPFAITVPLPLFMLQRTTVPSKLHSLCNRFSYCKEKQHLQQLFTRRGNEQSLHNNFLYCKEKQSFYKTVILQRKAVLLQLLCCKEKQSLYHKCSYCKEKHSFYNICILQGKRVPLQQQLLNISTVLLREHSCYNDKFSYRKEKQSLYNNSPFTIIVSFYQQSLYATIIVTTHISRKNNPKTTVLHDSVCVTTTTSQTARKNSPFTTTVPPLQHSRDKNDFSFCKEK